MKKVYIIAELAQSYEGDLGLAKKLVKAAACSGADAVKFQIFEYDELCTSDYEHCELFKSLKMSISEWSEVIDLALKLKVDFLADIFGTKTLDWISKKPIAGIKIHGSDVKNLPLLKKLQGFKKTVYLSVGGSHINEITNAIEIIGTKDVVLMSGFQGEPNVESDVELEKIRILKQKFKLKIGYADHIDANDSLAMQLPSFAVIAGADVIEKHITLERNFLQLEDSISALNPEEFQRMCESIRKIQKFNWSKEFELGDRERKYRLDTKKVIVGSRDLKKGDLITDESLCFLRVKDRPEELLDINDILGKKVTKDLPQYEPFTKEHLR